jgi:hypothetical protein
MEDDWVRSLPTFPKTSIDSINVFLIITVWLGMLVLVNPIGNFPLDDDWAYGWTVKTFLETGEYQLSDWTATNLLPQVIWGTLFCLPLGFSFTALRISTLVLGLLGVLTTYGLLREVGANLKIALLGASLVALNPIYFSLSNSFNSDVPSFTFAISSLYFITRGLRLDSKLTTLTGILISFIAILNRQSGIVILVAFGFAFLVKKGLKIKTLLIASFPTLVGLLLQATYSSWLNLTAKTPLLYGFQIRNIKETFSAGFVTIASTYLENAIIMSAYVGLFLFPFLAICFISRFKSLSSRNKRLSLLVILLMLAMGGTLILKGKQMPLAGITLGTYGIGPEAFDGYSANLSSSTKALFNRIWELLTLLGFAGAGILFLYVIPNFSNGISRRQDSVLSKRWLLVLSGSATLLYLLLIAGLDKKYWFDRYLIFLLPVLMIFVAILSIDALEKKLHWGVFATVLSILFMYGSFTITATHDYLSWNRVRWQALNDLTINSQVKPEQIYGGTEFNGWHFGNQLETCNPSYQSSFEPDEIRWGTFDCLWGEDTNTYQYIYKIGFIEQPGYLSYKKYSFNRLLPWKRQDLYVLKRI